MGRSKVVKQSAVDAVHKRLEAKARPERTKRTLVLSKNSYDEFEKLCRSKGYYPSEVIDEFIQLYVSEKG